MCRNEKEARHPGPSPAPPPKTIYARLVAHGGFGGNTIHFCSSLFCLALQTPFQVARCSSIPQSLQAVLEEVSGSTNFTCFCVSLWFLVWITPHFFTLASASKLSFNFGLSEHSLRRPRTHKGFFHPSHTVFVKGPKMSRPNTTPFPSSEARQKQQNISTPQKKTSSISSFWNQT